MLITEEEKQEILSKYSGNTSDLLLNHLKRNFPAYDQKIDTFENPFRFIVVDGKAKMVRRNKKYLVGRISHLVEDDFAHLGVPVIRRTVKKYIDGITNFEI